MFAIGDIIIAKEQYYEKIHVRKAKIIKISEEKPGNIEFVIMEDKYPFKCGTCCYGHSQYYILFHQKKKDFNI